MSCTSDVCVGPCCKTNSLGNETIKPDNFLTFIFLHFVTAETSFGADFWSGSSLSAKSL